MFLLHVHSHAILRNVTEVAQLENFVVFVHALLGHMFSVKVFEVAHLEIFVGFFSHALWDTCFQSRSLAFQPCFFKKKK